MEKFIVDFINKNKADVKSAIIALVIINILIVGMSGMSGSLIWLFTHLLNIAFANVTLIIPLIYLFKFIREN